MSVLYQVLIYQGNFQNVSFEPSFGLEMNLSPSSGGVRKSFDHPNRQKKCMFFRFMMFSERFEHRKYEFQSSEWI